MIGWAKSVYERWRRARIRKKRIDPASFIVLADEIDELARMAGRLGPAREDFQERIRRIEREMDELRVFTGSADFRRLSPERRVKLRKSLIHSRDQLLETVRNAPAPTDTLQ